MLPGVARPGTSAHFGPSFCGAGAAANSPAAWNVGGLSLTRIATLKLLYQVQKAYHMRPEPEDSRKNVPAKGEDALRDFGRHILDAMERMREQRVKQLASRIAEAALGVGRTKPAEGKRDRKRPCQRVDKPCHAVVIENLTNYRPEETRTRRENRQLMSWSAAKVKKYLSEACQLHGLHLREVSPGYTSRQDSRTGAPGIRCTDVPVADFVRQGGYLWKRVKKALQEVNDKREAALRETVLLADLYAHWNDTEKTWMDAKGVKWVLGPKHQWSHRDGTAIAADRSEAPASVRIAQQGGELFVSADPLSPAARGLQADLNAAANIGLKALLDPDWAGKWWYVPCCTKDGKPSPEKTKGSICIDELHKPLCDPPSESAKKRAGKRQGDIINIWRNPSPTMDGPWLVKRAYWDEGDESVISRVVAVLRAANGLAKSQAETVEPGETPW